MNLSDWKSLAEIIQALAIFGVFVTAWVAVRQQRVSATTDLFHRFNDPIARDHRRWVYKNCIDLTNRDKLLTLEKEPRDLEHLESVCNSLDWAGLLVQRGLLNKTDAIELYGDSVVRCWVILKPWIEHTRDRRRSRGWLWENIDKLQNEAARTPKFQTWVEEGVPIYTPAAIVTIDYHTSTVKRVDAIA